MKKILYIAFLLGMLTFVSSCKKSFLDVEDKSVLLRQVYVKDLTSMGDFLNGIYATMGESFFTGYSLIYPDLIADNVKPVTTAFNSQYTWTQISQSDLAINMIASSRNVNAVWTSGYRIARNSSFVLEEISKYRAENPAKADDMAGQAYVLRAWAHFSMVNMFAQSYSFSTDGSHLGIPYINTSDWKINFPRVSVQENYAAIIADLQQGISLLSPGSSNTLYINRTAALALLSKVYFYKGDYTAAKNTARPITTSNPLMTIAAGYPVNIYRNLPLSQTESLFQMPPSNLGMGGATYSTNFPGHYFGAPTNSFSATSDIATILKENVADARSGWVNLNGVRWEVRKYPANIVPGWPSPGTRAYYQTLIRSSELYLICAESYARLSMEDSSRSFLNAVRTRALPAAIPVTATGTALLDSVYKESRKELCFEGFRMYELQRLKKSVNRIDAPNPAAKDLPYPNNRAIAPIHGLDVQMLGLPQNPGY